MIVSNHSGVQLRIRGKVQGVGFRLYVWQLTRHLQLHDDVYDDDNGVAACLQEDPMESIAQLHQYCLPLVHTDSAESEPFARTQQPADFSVRQSVGSTMNTQIIPDAVTCPECLVEINAPSERRYRHPFINYTHCDPHFTTIRAMPYDRPFTVVAPFPFCV